MLHNAALEAFGAPDRIVCDYFKVNDLRDAVRGTAKLIPRRTRWSEATADIGALRKMVADGPLAVAPSARPILTASLAAAMVKPDESGGVRLVKQGTNNTSRDDVCAALVLVAGSLQRALAFTGKRGGMTYRGMAPVR